MVMICRIEGPLDLRTKFDLELFSRILKKTMNTQENFILLFSSEKLTRLFLLREVNPSPDYKMIILLTFDNLFHHYDILTKT